MVDTIPALYRFAEVVASEKRLTTDVRDDAIQEAVISALVVRDRGESGSYIRATIRNAIIATGIRHRPMTGEVRSNNGHNRPTTTPLTTTNDDGDEVYTHEPAYTPDFLRKPVAEIVWETAEDSLDCDDYALLRMVYLDGRTVAEASKALGYAASWGSRRLTATIYPRLAEELEELEFFDALI